MKRAEALASESGSMDDLRIRIWDYLYRLGRAQQLAIIAEQMNQTPHAIQQAVHHPWFNEADGMIAIAQA